MELEWLEDFLSVARSGSFSRSAEERAVTQPAFSRRIRALEFWVGAPLVDRSTYPTRLTAAGRMFRDVASEALWRLQAVREDIRDAEAMTRESISFTAMHSIAVSFFPDWLCRLERDFGGFDSRVIADNMHSCVEQLVHGNCHFLLCLTHPLMPLQLDPALYPWLPLGSRRLIPVSAAEADRKPRYALPGSKAVPIPYLAYAPDSHLGRAVEVILRQPNNGCHLRRHYENTLVDSLKSMALAGHGLAWLPEDSIAAELKRRRLIPAGGPEWQLSLELRIYRRAEGLGATAEALWNFLSGQPPTEKVRGGGRRREHR